MITTPWDRIDAAVLQALCDAGDAGEAESSTLDFKQAAPLTQGQDRRNEFAKDISAFANANGGDLVYGIEEIDAHACRLVPTPGETFDALTRRLNQVLANPVEPRVAEVRLKEVALTGDGFALVVRVPRSFDGPHRYTVTPEHQRFMTRTDTGAIDMEYTELRDAFGRTATLIEKARAFRANRLDSMDRGHLMKGLVAGPKFCVHLIPLVGLAQGVAVDIAAVYHRNDVNFVKPSGYVPQKQTNLDGLLMMGPAAPPTGKAEWLARLFRNGALEYLAKASNNGGAKVGGEASIPAVVVSAEIRRVCAQLLSHARALGFEGPALVGLAGIECGRHPFLTSNTGGIPYGNGIADQEHLVLPEHVVESLASDVDVDTIARPLLDAFWQCFGEVRCELYDTTGEWASVG